MMADHARSPESIQPSGTGVYNLSGGTLTVGNEEYVGDHGSAIGFVSHTSTYVNPGQLR
jgi:hypothetical protein